MSVQIIHTQAQAQAELERQRAVQRAYYAQRKERMQNDPEYREQQQTAQRANNAQRQQRMQNDLGYCEQVLQSQKTKRDQKRKAMEDDPLHANARKEADRIAEFRRVAREAQQVLDAQEQEDMIEKVHQRYVFSYTISHINTL